MEIAHNKCECKCEYHTTAWKSMVNCIKIRQNDLVQKKREMRQKFDFGMEQNITTLLPTYF